MTDYFDTSGSAGNPTGLCLCGCGEPAPLAKVTRKRLGYRVGEPTLYVYGHCGRPPQPLESRYVVNAETGCWEWTAYRDEHGYGRCSHRSRMRLAHRVVYERFVGPVPEGMQLDHLCRNPPCVNPDHLEPVTPTENVRRGVATKLTLEQVREIRGSSERGIDLAARFEVAPTTISGIRRGRAWRDEEAQSA